MAADRRRIVVLWTALLAALALLTWLRLERLAGLADQGYFAKYPHFADRLVAGELPAERLGDLSLGYLSAVTAGRAVGLGYPALRALQVAAVSLVALLLAAAVRRRWGTAAAVVAAGVVLSSRAALLNATEIEPETLILLLNAAALACFVQADEGRRWLLASGLLLGLSAVTRPTALAAAAVLVVASALRPGHRRQRAAAAVALAVGVALPVVAASLAVAALPGAATPMNPGTVLSEGWNPATTGLAGDAPQVVKDLEATLGEPDALHVAYRQVAAHAVATSANASTSNGFWAARAAAFVRTYPTAALALAIRKLGLAVGGHDAWDLATVARKERELSSPLWLPLAWPLALAAVGVALGRRPGLAPALFALAYLAVMVAFYVTARQRLALLPAVAVLAALAVHHLLARWRSGQRRTAAVAAAAAALVGGLLAVAPATAREDAHGWALATRADTAERAAEAADRHGDQVAAVHLRTVAALLRYEPVVPEEAAAALGLLEQVALEEAPADRFDLAHALMAAARWADAERLLGQLAAAGYAPRRGVVASRSLAFYRARCALRQSRPEAVGELLATAAREAPGDVRVLALAAAWANESDDFELCAGVLAEATAVHDPFTLRLARAEALADLGRSGEARAELAALTRDLPGWSRPAAVAATLPPTVEADARP